MLKYLFIFILIILTYEFITKRQITPVWFTLLAFIAFSKTNLLSFWAALIILIASIILYHTHLLKPEVGFVLVISGLYLGPGGFIAALILSSALVTIGLLINHQKIPELFYLSSGIIITILLNVNIHYVH